ncbi:MAG TPA: hypothetical protein VGF59_17595, partial [Bryobacteraceae bacterium]
MRFAALGGGSVPTQVLNVSSSGVNILFTATVSSGASWLRVNGQQTQLTSQTPAALTISADPTGLAPSTYNGSITLTGFGMQQSTAVVQVTLVVSTIGIDQQSLSFTYQIGASAPLPKTLTLSGPTTSYAATAATSKGGDWLRLQGLNGTVTSVPGTSPGSLVIVPNASVISGLAADTYQGTVTIVPSSGPSIVVPVTLTVSPAPAVTISPTTLVFNYQTGGANNQPTQTVQLTTASTQPVTYFAVNPKVDPNPAGRQWFTVSAPGTTFTNSSPGVVTVTIDPTNLPPSSTAYTGSFTLQTTGNPASATVNVKLLVSNSPLINVPAGPLSFTYQLGSTFPAAQNVKVTTTNAQDTATSGQLPLLITKSNNTPWLTVPANGTTGTAFAVSVDPTGLTPGSYNGSVTVTAPLANNSPQTIPVTLTVTNDPLIVITTNGCSSAIQPCSLIFPAQIGQSVPPQQVKVSSSTGLALSYAATAAMASSTACGNSWLTLTDATSGNTDGSFTVSANPTGIAAGTTCN